MVKLGRLATALSIAALLAACGGVSSPSTQTTEEFSGTIDPAGTASRDFSVSKTGELQLTLKSLTPRPVVGFITLAIGAPGGGTCQPSSFYLISQAAIGQQYSFPQITKGAYCLLLWDSAAILTGPTAFTASLSHP
jgi:hypothetical protein